VKKTRQESSHLAPQPQKGDFQARANGKDALKVSRKIIILMFLTQPKDQADP